ncbi:MAG: hypothetical protein NTX05_01625, partial [Fusobacteria bacterium]|nr:hypothetical protein [Fusobacteriota bacterium]
YSIAQPLPVNGKLTFALNLAWSGNGLVAQSIPVTCSANGGTVVTTGEIDVSVKPQGNDAAPSKVTVTITGSQLSTPVTLNITSYGTPMSVQNLPMGTYNITANISDVGYTATVSPSSVTVSSSTPLGAVVYYSKQVTPTSTLKLTLGSAPTATQANISIPSGVTIYVKDSAGNLVNSQLVSWGGIFQVSGLTIGQTYSISTSPVFNGKSIYAYSGSIVATGSNSLSIVTVTSSPTLNSVNLSIANLGSSTAAGSLSTSSYNGLTLNLKGLVNGSNSVQVPTGTYTGQATSSSGGVATISSFASASATIVPVNFIVGNLGSITYHLTFPVTSLATQGERIALTSNFTDLIMSNYVAGVVLGRMIQENPTYSKVHFDKDYMYGTLFAQLLQENINTGTYLSKNDTINTDQWEIDTLLSPGQGGPYQINDYSKRLETTSGVGLINFVALQKSLGYSIAAQDSGAQTASKGPEMLDNKYFGPMAAAYFHYNDILRMAQNNSETWGPQASTWSPMIANFSTTISDSNSFFDMILNACYNAGSYSSILAQFVKIGANYSSPTYSSYIANINNYSLNDAQYNAAVGVSSAGTFILYPRQARFYMDEMYNKVPGMTTNNAVIFPMSQLKTVFTNVMGTLAYVNASNQYIAISSTIANSAFDSALATNGSNVNVAYNLSNSSDRAKIFAILESATLNIEKATNFKFNTLTETTLNGK